MHAEEQGHIIGVNVCRVAPFISHLLSVDDSLIFMQADENNATCLKNILDFCCASSGLLSDAKSSIYF
jgi:hypothetical protein